MVDLSKFMNVFLSALLAISFAFNGVTYTQGQTNARELAAFKVKASETYATYTQVDKGFDRIERALENLSKRVE